MQFDNPSWDNLLGEKLIEQATPNYLKTKAEIVFFYQLQQAGGEIKSWRQALVRDLAAITGGKEKNLQRRFDPSRLANPEKRNAAQYEALGKSLGVTSYSPPPGGFKITWGADLWISKKKYLREHEVTFKGKAAQNLLDDPKWWKVIDAYFTDGGLDEVNEIADIDDEDSPVSDVDMIDYVVVEPGEE